MNKPELEAHIAYCRAKIKECEEAGDEKEAEYWRTDLDHALNIPAILKEQATDLLDKIAGRAWTIDGVEDVKATVVPAPQEEKE